MKKTYIATLISNEQASEIFSILEKTRQHPDHQDVREDFIGVILKLIEFNLTHFFWHPIELLEVEGWARRVAKVGISTAQGALSMIIRRVLQRLSSEQVVQLTKIIQDTFFVHFEA